MMRNKTSMFQATEIGGLLSQVELLTMTVPHSEEDQTGHLHTSLSTVSERNAQQAYSDITWIVKNMATLKEKGPEDRKTSF